MRGVIRLAVVPAILLVAGGCATKDWVKNLVGQKEAEIDQRVGTRVGAVETQVGQQGEKVTWIEGELGTVKTTAGEMMVKELKRRTTRTIELRSVNPEHPDRVLDSSEIAWIARILWASQ